MGVRDEDLKRLKNYAKGLGLRIYFRKYKDARHGSGGWDFSDPKHPIITVYYTSYQSKTETILTLLHELGHHLDWVHRNKRMSKKVEKAFAQYWEDEKKLTPAQRKLIYESECDGIQYMSVIAKETGIKLPMWKIQEAQEFDRWVYYIFLRSGKEPSRRERFYKSQELREKWRQRK